MSDDTAPMRERFTVRDFDPEQDLQEAAELLAARHRHDRQRFPILPERFEDASATRESLKETASFSRSVTALDTAGRMVGFMFAIRRLPAPTSTFARSVPARSTMMFSHGHAVSESADAYDVYHALYAVLAEEWMRDGLFEHIAHVPSGPAEQSWFDLGFGRHMAVAIRDLRPVRDVPARAEVRIAGPDDLTTALEICNSGTDFHATSPILQPVTHSDTDNAVREKLTKALADEGQAVLLARDGNRDTGILWIQPGTSSPLATPEKALYIGDTAVLEKSRGGGVGRALLHAAIQWAGDHGYEHLLLHFTTANALSRSFWTGNGFEPVMYHLRRVVDERIAWARGR
jgi:GNAT superfamily N-acetyltransferase